MMRVTNSMMLRSTIGDLHRAQSRLQDDQTTLSTGRTVRKMSDDPAAASSSMTLRAQLRRTEQHQRSISDAQGWLGTADTAIVSGLELMNRVKEVAVQAGNDGVANATTRRTLATEIGYLRDELLELANTEYLGRPVFNGTAAGAAYGPAGDYLGNDAAVVREVGSNTTIQVNVTGPAVFGNPAAPDGDVFAVLSRLQTAIETGDTAAIAAEHERLDAAWTTMSSAAAQIGVRGERLETIRNRRSAEELLVRETLAELEDADIAEALISVKASENAYTAALTAAARVLPPSLVDYLR
jgi:flagellar hook-associated protein 3 FlgL